MTVCCPHPLSDHEPSIGCTARIDVEEWCPCTAGREESRLHFCRPCRSSIEPHRCEATCAAEGCAKTCECGRDHVDNPQLSR